MNVLLSELQITKKKLQENVIHHERESIQNQVT